MNICSTEGDASMTEQRPDGSARPTITLDMLLYPYTNDFQQALANQSVTDFLILEYQDHIGGRMRNTKFGSDPSGNPYTVELGANWISGLGEDTVDGPENPVWTFSKQVNLSSPNSDAFSIATYNETGAVDYTDILDEFEEYWSIFEQSAGTILSENLQDRSFRAGLWQSGWRPKGDPARKAVEYYLWDWETAQTPEESSFVYGITGYNLTYYAFSEISNCMKLNCGKRSRLTQTFDSLYRPTRFQYVAQASSVQIPKAQRSTPPSQHCRLKYHLLRYWSTHHHLGRLMRRG
jgi:hypothetical protein